MGAAIAAAAQCDIAHLDAVWHLRRGRAMKRIAMVALALGACMQESGGSRMMTGGSGGGGVGGGDGGTGGFGGDAGAGGTGGMPMDIPSRQAVTFDITNGAAADRYVVTSGHFCDD